MVAPAEGLAGSLEVPRQVSVRRKICFSDFQQAVTVYIGSYMMNICSKLLTNIRITRLFEMLMKEYNKMDLNTDFKLSRYHRILLNVV